MQCASCGHNNPDDADFCEECAGDLIRACGACGTQNTPTAKFCKRCRGSLAPGVSGATVAAVPPPPIARPLPTAFASGRYAVRSFLGEGAKKRVYLAHDTKLDRDVAFALIKTDGLDADGIVRVRREAQAMGRLGDHGHIVTIFDTGDENGAPFIVSQYRGGGSVEDVLAKAEQHRIPAERAMRIAEQVCQALQHAHGRGVIHRDLKPGNVWLDADGNAALGDFGLAVAIDRSRMTMVGMMVGTVAYMPPEQALGRTPDARSDLYALGAMLYEIVTGRPPFLGDDAVGVISQHINTPPVDPSWHTPECPKPLEALILRLLAKSPDERPASAQDVAQELRRILDRSTVDTVQPQAPDAADDLRGISWGRFVGRREEMDQLKGTLEAALSGKGGIVMLVGEPGIGKTRLAEEFTVYAGLRGAQVLIGHCYEGEGSIPYRPFIEAFRQYAHARPDAELRSQLGPGAPEIATLVSEIRERFPDIAPAPQLDAEAERLRLFDSITQFLRNASRAQPIVLHLDDLHWADKPSLLLLQHVARIVGSERLLVVGAYRDVDLDRKHPLAEALGTVRRQENFTRIVLRGPPESAIDELLAAMEPSEQAAAGRHALAAALHHETEGNPLFLREVISHLIEEGKLRREDGRWTAGALTIADLGIPEGVREVIGRRLSRLSEPCNRLLTRASAMTRGFTWEALQAIAGLPEEQALDLLDEALAAQLIAERRGETPTTYDFTHALIRQTLYEELSTPRRVLLHRQVGEALEQLWVGSIEPHVGELAYHFYQAAPGGDAEKGIDYTTRAGDRAAALNGHDDAISHYERAVQILELAPQAVERRCALLLKLGDVQWKAGQAEAALSSYRQAADVARAMSSADALAEAAIGFAEAAWRVYGDLSLRPESERMLAEALVVLGDIDSPLRVHALGLRTRAARSANDSGATNEFGTGGYSIYVGGRDPEHVDEARLAVEIARRIGDPALIASALYHFRGCLWRPDNPQERLAISTEMADTARQSADLGPQMLAATWLTIDQCDVGDIGAWETVLTEMERLAALTRQPLHGWHPVIGQAALAIMRGELDKGEHLMNEALHIGQEAHAPEAVSAFGGQLTTLRYLQGRAAEVEGVFRQTLASSPTTAVYKAVLATVLAETGRRDEARSLLKDVAADDFSSVPRDYMWLTTVWLLGSVCLNTAAVEPAELLYNLAAPYASQPASPAASVCLGSMSLPLLQFAIVLERWDDAERHYADAVEQNTRMGARPYVVLAQREFADMLLRRDAPGDRERALELLQRTLDEAQEIGMKKVVTDCVALKVRAQGIDQSSAGLYTSIDTVARAVELERPQVSVHPAPDGTVTIMFSDIEDSTVLTERLGDQAWQDLLRKHNALIREQLAAHDGYEVKTMGDGFMVAFQSAKKGLDCAIAIQRAFAAVDVRAQPVAPSPSDQRSEITDQIRIRIGLHAGEAIKDGDDFYGKNVIMASRVAGKALGGEILVSSLLRQLVESSVGAAMFSEPREVELKGLSGTHVVYAIGA